MRPTASTQGVTPDQDEEQYAGPLGVGIERAAGDELCGQSERVERISDHLKPTEDPPDPDEELQDHQRDPQYQGTSHAGELLTTGEAAKILNSSRQHVVDLCDRGDLSFTTTGRHRRVNRADLETLRTRTQRLTRDQLRSLWLSHAVAGALVQDPVAVLAVARLNLPRMREVSGRGQGARWLDEWQQVLDGPVEGVMEALTSRSPRSRELRQNSPFAGVLSAEDRLKVLEGYSKVPHAGSRS